MWWLIANSTSRWMFALGVGLMAAILLRRSVRYFGRRRKEERRLAPGKREAPTHSTPRQPLIDAPPETLRWQVEMHETARDLKAELDSKASVVQTLIQMAQEERERLEQAIERAEQLGISPYRDPLTEIERLADQPTSNEDAAFDRLAPLPAQPNTPGGHSATRDHIYGLSDQGFAASDIAEQTGVAIGEVEMILNLRPMRN